RVQLEMEEQPRDHLSDLSIGGMTPADLTESALRTVLFGEPNPLTGRHMGFATEIEDPLSPLRPSPVSEEIIRPLSELLVTDLLVGSGRARSIRAFRLGISIRGRRRLTLAWETPSRYANDPVTVRSISGAVNL